MDELFGRENFISEFVWHKKNVVQNDAQFLSVSHEYIVAYTTNILEANYNLADRNEEQIARYQNPDNDPRGDWTSVALQAKSGSSTYEITFPNGVTWKPVDGTYPRLKRESMEKAYQENRLWFGKNGKNVPRLKKYLSEVKQGVKPVSILKNEIYGSTQQAKERLKTLLEGNYFETPKPIDLIQYLIGLAEKDTNSLILDAFAGSGTTGHATLRLNAEDGGNRKFILIQQPEEIKPETTAHQAGFTTVDAITRERLRRVIDGVPSAKDAQLQQGLGGSFTAVTLGEPINLETLALATDETLPSRENLGRFVFYNTTLQALETLPTENATGYLGETATHKVYLLYKPERQALTGTTCAFTLERAERIARELAGTGKEAIVYAPISFVDAKTLKAKKWAIRYCNLPYELLQLNPVKPAPEGLV